MKTPIVGIRHVDFEPNPSKVQFSSGKIGDEQITLDLRSHRGAGINSKFTFYTI